MPSSPGQEPDDTPAGPYYIRKQEGIDYDERIPDGTYCGQVGCVDGASCITNQQNVPWEYNPQQVGNKPDVLAPVHFPIDPHDEPFTFEAGTSFAAPIVTGSIGCILDELRETGSATITPYQMRKAVIEGSALTDKGLENKFDATGVRRELGII